MGSDKAEKNRITETLEAETTKMLYVNPAERSALEIYPNYKQVLAKDRQCADNYVGATLGTKFGINSIGNKAGRYRESKLNTDQYTAYLVIGVIDKYTDIHVIEMRPMDTDKVAFDLETMGDDIDKSGFVVIEGLYFDTDNTELTASSQQALDTTADLLRQKPDVNFLVMGHTDSQGKLMESSKGRGSAVMTTLAQDYNILQARLSAHGMGPLSPIASNKDKQTMAKNRRVVLVQK